MRTDNWQPIFTKLNSSQSGPLSLSGNSEHLEVLKNAQNRLRTP